MRRGAMQYIRQNWKVRAIVSTALALPLLFSYTAAAQTWSWTKETVDTTGKGTALAVDSDGNVHISYGTDGEGLKYGYRPAGRQSHWFTMKIGGGVNSTDITVDQRGNAQICATYLSLPLRYSHFDGTEWHTEKIAPEDSGGVEWSCTVGVSSDGAGRVSWYRIAPDNTAHMRFAALKDGVWQMRTVDFAAQTGKWESMVMDSQGNPNISYDSYVNGELKFAHWDGKDWVIQVVDTRGAHGTDYNLGMGNHLALDSAGNAHISYYTATLLRYASQEGQTWKIQDVVGVRPTGSAVDFRSSLVLDKDGKPHISYEEAGTLKHAYWDGQGWRIQIVSPTGSSTARYSSMAIDHKENVIYLAFLDPVDGSVQVAVGREASQSQITGTDKKQDKN